MSSLHSRSPRLLTPTLPDDDIAETLAAEVVVDMARLRALSRHGIPPPARGLAWSYLLGARLPDRSHEMSAERSKTDAYLELGALISGQSLATYPATTTTSSSASSSNTNTAGEPSESAASTSSLNYIPQNYEFMSQSQSSVEAFMAFVNRERAETSDTANISFSGLSFKGVIGTGNEKNNVGASTGSSTNNSTSTSEAQSRATGNEQTTLNANSSLHSYMPAVQSAVRSELRGYLARSPLLKAQVSPPSIDLARGVFERVLSRHYALAQVPEDSSAPLCVDRRYVSLLAPLVFSIPDERDVFYCFQGLVHLLKQHFHVLPLHRRVGAFMRLFRLTMPELFNYFEEEGVDARNWCYSWFKYLLACEAPLECVLRLWDTYFAESDGFELHTYVCLAILNQLKEYVEDLECTEIATLMRNLPFRLEDVEPLINSARNIRLTVESGIYDDD